LSGERTIFRVGRRNEKGMTSKKKRDSGRVARERKREVLGEKIHLLKGVGKNSLIRPQ